MTNRHETTQHIMAQLGEFVQAERMAMLGDYDGAMAKVKESALPDDVRSRLAAVLESRDDYAVSRVFEDYALRLGNAFCETCWEKD